MTDQEYANKIIELAKMLNTVVREATQEGLNVSLEVWQPYVRMDERPYDHVKAEISRPIKGEVK